MEKSVNANDPFLQIILEEGFDEVIVEQSRDNIYHLKKNGRVMKCFSEKELEAAGPYIIKGKDYKWLADADGSSNRFRNFINK